MRPRFLVCVLISVIALVSSGLARASNSYGKTVDDRVAAAADADPVKTDYLNLLVTGTDPVKAVQAVKGVNLVSLGGTTATGPGVPYATVDGANVAWAAGYNGSGVGIAILDSGVTSSSDFGTRLTQVPLSKGQDMTDYYGHGTFIAGVAAGRDDSGWFAGVAPGARILSFKVSSDAGARTKDLIKALNWITGDANKSGYNIRVIVISATETNPTSFQGSLLDAAIEHAWRVGYVVVVASGNLGPGAQFFAPANDPFPIVVGALDDPTTAVTSFSSNGTTPDGYARPDLVAPGRHIVSILPGGSVLASQAPSANLIAPEYGMGNGTSFAAPQVAGAAAILLHKNRNLTPNQVKGLLVGTARPVDGSSAPALDIAAATAYAGTPPVPNQAVPTGNCASVLKDDPCNSLGAA